MDIFHFHILPRLPAKSIIRFLFVCKQWQSFLTTTMFADMHHHHHHKLLLIVLSTTTPCKFQTLDCESPEEGLSIVSRPLPFETTNHKNVSIVASVRGLVCVRIINYKSSEKEYSDLILWNPLTGEYKTLSRPNNKQCQVTFALLFGLYYSCNDYKILLVRYRNVHIYSLKTDSWRKVETTQDDLIIYSLPSYWPSKCWRRPCILLDDKLYFIVYLVGRKLTSLSLIAFDLKTEKLRYISRPSSGLDPDLWAYCLSLTVIRGCIHLCMSYRNSGRYPKSTCGFAFVLWRMDRDGDWTKVAAYNCNPLLFPWFLLLDGALHLMKNENWLVDYDFDIYKVDFKERRQTKLFSYDNNKVIFAPGKYIETVGIKLFS